ncbi:hypothetical protein PENSPDRAFT_657764 [Peniophora sp. CONT]|nr:hypothetical protein PENSPDRAFT_657764 [Peniophora sp. CONT]
MQGAQVPMYPPVPPPQGRQAYYVGPDQATAVPVFPRVGETRCYWTLLSSSLRFLYLDPVLQYHLQDQASSLIGTSIIDLVHPDERHAAQRDLSDVLQTGNLDGTLTRMRFSRLSRVRRMLGHQGPAHYWADADKIAIDVDWMAVDLVANVASDDLLLVFIHAAVDLSPLDSDPHQHSSWSNWCGTSLFDGHAAPALFHSLCTSLPVPSQTSRVFQIMSAQQPHTLLLSWPPEQPHAPAATEYARLAEGVNLSRDAPASSAAKTSCTRRFKAREQAMSSQDAYRLVDSVFIPHGSIIFACHHVKQARRTSAPAAISPMHSLYMTQPHQEYLDSFGMQSLAGAPYLPSPPQPQVSSQQHQAQTSTHVPSQSHSHVPSQTYPAPHSQSASWSPPAQDLSGWQPSYADSSYETTTTTQPDPVSSHPQWLPHSSPFDSSNAPYRSDSPPSYFSSVHTAPAEVPLPPVRTSPSASSAPSTSGAGPVRNAGLPPAGVQRCSSCKVTHSPEWRKGPSGKKDLCNACGLRYARSRAKKEGLQGIRKRGKSTASTTTKAVRQNSAESNPFGAASVAGGAGAAAGRPQSSPTPAPFVPVSVQRDVFDDFSSTSSPTDFSSAASGMSAPALKTPSPPLYMHDMSTSSSGMNGSTQMHGTQHTPLMAPTPTPPGATTSYQHSQQDNTPPMHARPVYPPAPTSQKQTYMVGYAGESRAYAMQQQQHQAYGTQLPPFNQLSHRSSGEMNLAQGQDGGFMPMYADPRQQTGGYIGLR